MILSANEKIVDAKLLKLKSADFSAGIKYSYNYTPSLHFFDAKPLMEVSPIFKFIQRMPKGGNLHLHNRYFWEELLLISNDFNLQFNKLLVRLLVQRGLSRT